MMKIDGLHGYEDRSDGILSWLGGDWIDDLEYDRRILTFEPSKTYLRYNLNDYLLPSTCGNPSGEYGDWIFLVQTLVQLGYVERRKKGKRVFYRRKPQ